MSGVELRSGKRLHFGVLFSMLNDTGQQAIWNGIVKYAKANDIHLTAYIGAHQISNYDYILATHFDTCFETIKCNSSLDGVIIFSGFIAQITGFDTLVEYTKSIPKHIPVVSVSLAVPGVPSIMSDNIGGIFSAVDHLIKAHGKRQLAFVKGPDGHHEAEERYTGYKMALEVNGIALDERYVFPGQSIKKSGHEAVANILDTRKLPVDAIVGIDDETAIGVLTELKRRNIAVPKDIAVTGFDDDVYSAGLDPSLSSVRQDYPMMGQTAAEILCDIIKGKPFEDVKIVPTLFIARKSCGCLENPFHYMKSILDNVTTEDICIDAFTQHEFSKIFQHDVPQETVSQWAVTLAKAITQKPFNRDGFLYTLDDILAQFKIYSGMYSLWNNALNILTLGVELYKNEFESTDLVLSTLVFAVTHISNIRYKEEKNEEFLLIDSRMLLREMISNLVLIYDIDSLADELFKSLSELSINTVLVGLYHSPIKSNDKRTARAVDTVIGFDVDTRFNINHSKESTVFFSDYSTIDGFDFERERLTFFFLPLFFKDEEIGALLLPYDTQVPEDVYETLRVNISTAVKGAELMSRIQTLSITDELTGLLNRRGFLQFVKSRLLHFRRETSISPMVLFMDMDGLKAINDTYGHNEGDIAIKAFSNILKDSLREEDIIGRLGGDEFVVLSAVKSNESGEMIIMRLRADIDKYNSKKLHAYNVSASIGSVILHEATDECFEAAMLTADNVLYEEKSKKRKKAAIH